MYLLKQLQGDTPVLSQLFTLLCSLQAQLIGLLLQRSNLFLQNIRPTKLVCPRAHSHSHPHSDTIQCSPSWHMKSLVHNSVNSAGTQYKVNWAMAGKQWYSVYLIVWLTALRFSMLSLYLPLAQCSVYNTHLNHQSTQLCPLCVQVHIITQVQVSCVGQKQFNSWFLPHPEPIQRSHSFNPKFNHLIVWSVTCQHHH